MRATAVPRRPIVIVAIAAVLIAAAYSVFVLRTLQINNALAWFIFGAWLLIPYAGATWLVLKPSSRCRQTFGCVAALIISVGGALFLFDVTQLHSDAQGALAVLMLPLLQLVAGGATTLFGALYCKRRAA